MAGGTRHRNFCNNIETYHKKKKEEQFYDFTIRDKDDLEVKSHKFIVASQYNVKLIADLLRFHSNCVETKFVNFSNDEIKRCINQSPDYGHVIGLGYTLEIKELVEAGVSVLTHATRKLFFLKN